MLDKLSYKILKKFYKHISIPFKSVRPSNPILNNLLSHSFITCINDDGTTNSTAAKEKVYQITLAGRAYVENRKRDDMRFKIPVVISIVALVFSFISITATVITVILPALQSLIQSLTL